MRLTIGVAALAFAALATAAQAQPPYLPLRNDPAPGGITVQGSATIHVPADALRFEARLTARNGRGDSAQMEAETQHLAQALIDNGASGLTRQIEGTLNQNGPAFYVSGMLRHPTLTGAEALLAAAGLTLGADSPLVINYANATLVVDDCTAAEARAGSEAMAAVRRRAASVAREAGVVLGGVVAVSQYALTCATPGAYGLGNYGPVNNRISLDKPFDVPVTVSETVTFAIR